MQYNIFLDLLSSIAKQGWILTVAGICIGLYVNAMVRDRADAKDQSRQDIIDNTTRVKEQQVLDTILATEHEILECIKISNINAAIIAEAIKTFSASTHSEHDEAQHDLTDAIQELKLISSNQLASATGLQRIIEQLINAIKD